MQGKTIHVMDGETLKVSNQWAAHAEQRGATVSSSTWAGTPTLGAVTLSGTVATALITATCDGHITNTVVLSSGETLVNERQVRMTEGAR